MCAKALREPEKLLEETLEEEKAADQKLTSIAKKVNVKASTLDELSGFGYPAEPSEISYELV